MGFKTMLAGLIFIFFNINIGYINILPDFIGYILFIFGSSSAYDYFKNDLFLTVRSSSIILSILSLMDLFIKHSNGLNEIINNPLTLQGKIFSFLFYSTIASLFVYCMYNLCKAIENEAISIRAEKLTEKSRKGFMLFLVYQLCFYVFFIVGLFIGEKQVTFHGGGAILLFCIAAVIMIYVYVKILLLLKEAEKTFDNQSISS
ncbi:MAG: hypothetical protein ACO1OT_08055 [Heyndrickxia sp.]